MKQTIISLLILIAGFNAQAQAEDVKIIENGPTKMLYRDTSEANRVGKKFSVIMEPVGIGPMGLPEAGINGAYYINRNDLIQLELGYAAYEGDTSSYGGLDYKRAGLHYKHFAGNSFYIKTGLDYRTIKYSTLWGHNDGTVSKNYELEGNALSMGFVIGNQWQWENFLLGCDWFGTSVTVASNVTRSEIALPGSYTSNEMHSEEARFLKESKLQFLRFYVGYSF